LNREQTHSYNSTRAVYRFHQEGADLAQAPAIYLQKQDNSTEAAGQRLRRARERLNLKFRDVEQASQSIAERRGNPEFGVLISRLSDIENQGTLPSLYRLYSLCCIYRLDLNEVLGWYGIPVAAMAADSGVIQIEKTHAVHFNADAGAEAMVPLSLDPGIDLRRTFFVSEVVQRWGKLPLALLSGIDISRFRYGFVGTDDWGMYPAIPPGSLLIVDDTKRRIQASGWKSLSERPIYFLEHRDGYYCRWCSVKEGVISLTPDPASDAPILNFQYPGEIEVVGQVVGVAMSLDPEKRRRIRP
jgi:transcriptional regulator with XRE-family HTH domain